MMCGVSEDEKGARVQVRAVVGQVEPVPHGPGNALRLPSRQRLAGAKSAMRMWPSMQSSWLCRAVALLVCLSRQRNRVCGSHYSSATSACVKALTS